MSTPNLLTPPTPYAGNPIIPLLADKWYTHQVFDFCPVLPASTIYLFASGISTGGIPSGEWTIGLFTAPSDEPWNVTDQGVVITPDVGWKLRVSAVLYRNSTFMVYGTEYADDFSTIRCVLWTSSVAAGPYTRYGVVLDRTSGGRDDGGPNQLQAVLYDDADAMFYSIYCTREGLPALRSAESEDGYTWTKTGSGDLLTTVPEFVEFHDFKKIGGEYVLLYETGSFETHFRIRVARSSTPDGAYTTDAGNFLEASGVTDAWDEFHVATLGLLQIGAAWKAYACAAGDVYQDYTGNTWAGGLWDVALTSVAWRSL